MLPHIFDYFQVHWDVEWFNWISLFVVRRYSKWESTLSFRLGDVALVSIFCNVIGQLEHNVVILGLLGIVDKATNSEIMYIQKLDISDLMIVMILPSVLTQGFDIVSIFLTITRLLVRIS